jgi:hypothetical protein
VTNEREIERYGPDSARITDGSGRLFDGTCSYRVTAEVIERPASVLGRSWEGVFHAERAAGLKSGEGTLELPDGRSARIFITLNVDVLRGESMCTFVGSGAPPTR